MATGVRASGLLKCLRGRRGDFRAIQKTGIKLRSKSSWPLPASIEYGEQLQPLMPDPVWNDVRRAGHHEFPGSSQTAGPSHLGLRPENLDGVQNPPGDERRVPIRVLFNIFSDRDQVTDCPR